MDPAGGVTLGNGDALVIVDVQNDFLPGGSLAVPAGDEVVPVLMRYRALFAGRGLPVYATRDWHPPNHVSFVNRGGPWPPHCVAGTPGARFAPGLEPPPGNGIVSKATAPDREAYSGFDGTDLDRRLRGHAVRRLFVGGLATDYCVLRTVEDALALGYETFLLVDAVRAVDLRPDDGRAALATMSRLGARQLTLAGLAP